MTEFELSPSDGNSSHESNLIVVWECYPRKVGKRKALLEIERAISRLVSGEIGRKLSETEAVEELVKATSLYARSNAGQRGTFTPHPTTWFHQSRYLDDPDDWFHETPDEHLKALNQVGVYRP